MSAKTSHRRTARKQLAAEARWLKAVEGHVIVVQAEGNPLVVRYSAEPAQSSKATR